MDLDKTLIDFNKDIASSQDDIGKAYEKGQESLSKYNELLWEGMISQQQFNIAQSIHMEEYNTLVDTMGTKTQELTGFIGELHGAMDGFSQTSAEGLVSMSELLFQSGKGWQDFGDIVKDVIKSIARDIAVMGTKEFVTNPLFNMLKSDVARACKAVTEVGAPSWAMQFKWGLRALLQRQHHQLQQPLVLLQGLILEQE